jgi:carbon-monoxide dehydrogenase large subunit
VHGISESLLEELPYNEEGEPLANSFIDYLIASSTDVPISIELFHMKTPSPNNPLGVKGVGEGGAIAPMVAIASAVRDALKGSEKHLTIESSSSVERVWRLAQRKQGAA